MKIMQNIVRNATKIVAVLLLAMTGTAWADCFVDNSSARMCWLLSMTTPSIPPQVGCYYAQQRGINPTHIAHVRVQDGYYID